MFQAETVQLLPLDEGFVELRFDRRNAAINKLDQLTLVEWRAASKLIAGLPDVRGVLVTSAKNVFIVGADINEFGATFQLPLPQMSAHFQQSNAVVTAFESLEVPTVVAINGLALGGGLEMTLAASLRVMSGAARVGLPEVQLGLFPGLGGTVRLPRLAGPAVAADWIVGGKQFSAAAAQHAGVVDEVCEPDALRATALACLRKAASGSIDWRALREKKRLPMPYALAELRSAFAPARLIALASAAKHQPSALMALELMERAAGLYSTDAAILESDTFADVAITQAAASLVRSFHNEQALKKLFRQHAKDAHPFKRGAVLGAGIMGGGIAYASAMCGVPVRLKDISDKQIDLGISEAAKLLSRQVKNARLEQDRANLILSSITGQRDYAGFGDVDVVIEAVVEDLQIKQAVLTELEGMLRGDAIIASNTSSLCIDAMARPLQHPENFVGMHFFNPVPVMPLVEVIKGSKSSDVAVSTAVAYALAMGKTPIVVKDCPGFLVNRILTPYIRAFLQLVCDGADFVQIDRVMETFGWPMGPAYLEDVIGIDTGRHVNDVISAGYPERMPPLEHDALRLLAEHRRHGQKNGIGFYRYEQDASGRPRKSMAGDTHELLAQLQPGGARAFSDQEIIDRMMLPLIVEAAHALEDGVVASPAELDMALLLGISFPKYLGGPLQYADWLGLNEVVKLSDKYAHLGGAYQATGTMRDMARQGTRYYAG